MLFRCSLISDLKAHDAVEADLLGVFISHLQNQVFDPLPGKNILDLSNQTPLFEQQVDGSLLHCQKLILTVQFTGDGLVIVHGLLNGSHATEEKSQCWVAIKIIPVSLRFSVFAAFWFSGSE